MIELAGLKISTDMLIGFAGGVGFSAVRGLAWKALMAAGASFFLLGSNIDVNSLIHQVTALFP